MYDLIVIGLSYLTCVLLARQSGENWEKALQQISLCGPGSIFTNAVRGVGDCRLPSADSFQRVGPKLTFLPRKQQTWLRELFVVGQNVDTGVDIEFFDPEFKRLFLAGDTSGWIDQPRGHRSLVFEFRAQCLETCQVVEFTNYTCIDLADVYAMMMSANLRVRDMFHRGLLCLVCLPRSRSICLVRIMRDKEKFSLAASSFDSVVKARWRQGHYVLRAS